MTNEEVLQLIQENLATRATQLNLTGENLTEIPAEIGQLKHLQRLNLKDNKLTSIPPEIGQLTKLQRIYLSNNKLTSIPPEIGQLKQLEIIYLGNNKLESIPPEIGLLRNLEGLYLSDNLLKELPQEIQNLTNLKNLDLRKNPLDIPAEVINQTHQPASIIKYYFQYQSQSKVNLKEAKIIVLGPASTGKTSLVKRLLGEEFTPNNLPTEGLEVSSWEINLGQETIEARIWDLGSQDNLHPFYQCTFSPESLYLLVTDVTRKPKENEYWLRMINSLTPKASVIVIGNKIDQAFWQIDRSRLAKLANNVKAFLEFSCKTGQGITELQGIINHYYQDFKFFKTEIPPNWLVIKEEIKKISSPYINQQEYQKICKKEVILETENQAKLANLLADTGVIIYPKSHPQLKDDTLYKPAWFIRVFHNLFNKSGWRGIIQTKQIQEILQLENLEQANDLLTIIQKLELAFPGEEEETFIIPALFKRPEPDTGNWTDALQVTYQYNYLPRTLMIRLIVKLRRQIESNNYWSEGLVVSNEDNRALIKANYEDQTIQIWVSGKEESRQSLLNMIQQQLEKINATTAGVEAAEKPPSPPVILPSLEKEVSHSQTAVEISTPPKTQKSKTWLYIALGVGAFLIVILVYFLS